MQDEMEREGGPQLPSFRQGWAGVFIRRVQGVGDNIRYAEKVGSGGKGRRNVETWSCSRQTRGVVCEGESGK